jgi:3-deoxy-D-manno-octulosonic-acid transferase
MALALRLWLLLAGLAPPPWSEAEPRPEGPLLWVHLDDPARLPAVAGLAQALAADGVATLLTLPPGRDLPAVPGALVRPAPSEAAAAAFAAAWRPDLLVWIGGGLRPALVARAPCPRLLVEGAPARHLLAAGRWLPGLGRATLALFAQAGGASVEAVERMRRLGLPREGVALLPPLDLPPAALPCNERERRDLAETLASRPVWLAAGVTAAEVRHVLFAQQRASRSAHRLLLILAPLTPEAAEEAARRVGAAGLRLASRADGAEPEAETQVYLAEGMTELGLWFRLAPVSFIGGTLAGGPGGRHPFEGAALGSALLHGPVTEPFGGAWTRLEAAGAARLVRNGAELGTAVETLLSPDRAAAMAHGAWDVATEGAEAANRLEAMVRARLPEPA